MLEQQQLYSLSKILPFYTGHTAVLQDDALVYKSDHLSLQNTQHTSLAFCVVLYTARRPDCPAMHPATLFTLDNVFEESHIARHNPTIAGRPVLFKN